MADSKKNGNGKGKKEKKVTATGFILQSVCDYYPNLLTNDQIKEMLAKKNLKATDSTIQTWKADTVKTLKYLDSKDRLK